MDKENNPMYAYNLEIMYFALHLPDVTWGQERGPQFPPIIDWDHGWTNCSQALSSFCPTEFRDPGSKIIQFFPSFISQTPQKKRGGFDMPCLLVMTPFVHPPPVCGPGIRRHPFSKGSLSRPQINLLKVPALFPFSCHSFFPCSFFLCAYQTLASPKMRSLSWWSGRVHAEVGGNSPGLLQTVAVRKSLSGITRMWATPGSAVSGMSIQCAISTSAAC